MIENLAVNGFRKNFFVELNKGKRQHVICDVLKFNE